MAIDLTRIDELAVVALDRAEVLNALNFELLRDLAAALDQVAAGDARALYSSPAPATGRSAPGPTSKS